MRIALDTNVLVSGLLSPFGASAEVLRLIVGGAMVPLYDARIAGEYRELLFLRELEINPSYARQFLDAFVAGGEPVTAAPLKKGLADPDDEMFLEVVLSGDAEFLITFNLKHFPAKAGRVRVVEPRVFLHEWRKR